MTELVWTGKNGYFCQLINNNAYESYFFAYALGGRSRDAGVLRK